MNRKILFIFLSFVTIQLSAQKLTVRGSVKDESGAEMLGVNVVEKGTSNGVVTDVKGNFQLEVAPKATLVFSFIGYDALEQVASTQMDVVLTTSAQALDEVIVTALGVEKKKGTVGYAAQEVKGDDLVKGRDANAIGSLTGKVTGLTIGVTPEMLTAPKVVLRGRENVLFVVDGVPISSDSWNISADDIESYTVLKGPSAAALYGYRGQNGAIMITTKRAKTNTLSVEINSNTLFEPSFLAISEVQNEYGPGSLGAYEFGDGRGGGTNDADYDV